MNRNALVLSALITLVFVTACAADPDKDDIDKLQGTWIVTSARVGGKTTQAPNDGTTWTFDKEKIVMKESGRPDRDTPYKIDASKTPRQLTFDRVDAIYELKGDTLRIALAGTGKRPTSLDDKDAPILYLKRDKR